MKRFVLVGALLIALALWPSLSSAQPDVYAFTLDNGLTVLLVPKPGTGITAVDHLGQRGEPQRNARDLGHLAFL
jgi:predicted Zn-dependent peptidase